MIMKRDSFFRQFNYDAPVKLFMIWSKKNKKAIKKWINIISFILLVIFGLLFCNYKIREAIASYTAYATEKAEREAYLEGQQMMRELALANKRKKDELNAAVQEKNRIDRENKRLERLKEELDQNYAIGNPIYITQINDSERLDSNVGKITKIQGLKLYGTWGEPINYDKSKIRNISAKEMKETREAENKKRINENQKKKKFVSWGTIGDGKKELPPNYSITYVGDIMIANKE